MGYLFHWAAIYNVFNCQNRNGNGTVLNSLHSNQEKVVTVEVGWSPHGLSNCNLNSNTEGLHFYYDYTSIIGIWQIAYTF